MLTRLRTFCAHKLAARKRRCQVTKARRLVGSLQSDLVMAQATQLFHTQRINELRIRLDAARRALTYLEKQA